MAGGGDTLTFDNSQTFGTNRISGWNTVALVNGATLTADGDLRLASGGRLTIDKSSTFYASAYYANAQFYENPESPIAVTGSISNAARSISPMPRARPATRCWCSATMRAAAAP